MSEKSFKEYRCEDCKKNYSSYQSLWNHNKKIHKKGLLGGHFGGHLVVIGGHQMTTEKVEGNICKYCDKVLCDRHSRWKHEQKCKNKNDLINKYNKLVKEVNNIKKEMKTINSNNNINSNNTINQINIFPLGTENITEKLTDNDKKNIMLSVINKFHEIDDVKDTSMPIVELVRKIYEDDKLKNFRNAYIPNINQNIGYYFDGDDNKFTIINKNKMIDKIIFARKNDIENIYSNYIPKKNKDFFNYKMNNYLDSIKKSDSKISKIIEEHHNEILFIIYKAKDVMKELFDLYNSNF
jgi:hypothetical protein